jgi:hypothetical protein
MMMMMMMMMSRRRRRRRRKLECMPVSCLSNAGHNNVRRVNNSCRLLN